MRKELEMVRGEVKLNNSYVDKDLRSKLYREYLLKERYSEDIISFLYSSGVFELPQFVELISTIKNVKIRDLLYYKFVGGLTYKEISNKTGYSLATCKRKLAKAIYSLQDTLRPLYLEKKAFSVGNPIGEQRKTTAKVLESYSDLKKSISKKKVIHVDKHDYWQRIADDKEIKEIANREHKKILRKTFNAWKGYFTPCKRDYKDTLDVMHVAS